MKYLFLILFVFLPALSFGNTACFDFFNTQDYHQRSPKFQKVCIDINDMACGSKGIATIYNTNDSIEYDQIPMEMACIPRRESRCRREHDPCTIPGFYGIKSSADDYNQNGIRIRISTKYDYSLKCISGIVEIIERPNFYFETSIKCL